MACAADNGDVAIIEVLEGNTFLAKSGTRFPIYAFPHRTRNFAFTEPVSVKTLTLSPCSIFVTLDCSKI